MTKASLQRALREAIHEVIPRGPVCQRGYRVSGKGLRRKVPRRRR
jgi:hypothetical protein